MKKRQEVYTYLVVMAFALFFLIQTVQLKYFSSKLLPLIITGSILVMSIAGLVKAAISKGEPRKTGIEDMSAEAGESWRGYAINGAWMVGYLVAITLIGFVAATAIMLLAYLKTHNRKWVPTIGFAAVTTLVVYFAFEVGMQLQLYRGLLFEWLG